MALFDDMKERWSTMRRRRDPWMAYWQNLAEVLLPNRADFTRAPNPGQSREVGIYDGTPRMALRDLASTLDGLMKPQTSNWFEASTEDDQIANKDDAKVWFEQVRDRMWKAIYNKNARFIQRSGECDMALSCFGWGILWIQERDTRDGLLFRSFPNSRVAFDENEDGVVDSFGFEELLWPRELAKVYEKYGKPIPQGLTDSMKPGSPRPDAIFPVVQLVMPIDDYNGRDIKVAKGMKFATVLFDIRNEAVIHEGGFFEFPAAIPRWDTAPGDVYPRSPGMMALPDARTLQAIGKTLLIGGQRAVDPPIWIQNDSILSPLRTFPGGITVLDVADTQGKSPIGTFPVSENIPLGREMQQDYRANVEAAFFKNVFKLPMQGQDMTATEVLERKDEFIRTIGPVFGRLETDYIGHTIDRVFAIMDRAGAFPPRPDSLKDKVIIFRFQSPIQQARKQLEIAGLSRAIELLAPLAEAQKEIMDNFDGDQIARDAPAWSGMSQRWLRSIEQRDQIRTNRQHDASGQAMAAAATPLSGAVKNVAQAQLALNKVPVQSPQPVAA